MPKSLITLAFCAAASVVAVPGHTDTYTSYFAFGDSLTDPGRLGLPEPYAGGRFSTGPVWAEFIADFFEAANLENQNFALGGATAGDANLNTYPEDAAPFGTFNGQIDIFDVARPFFDIGDNPLVSVLLGANDIFQGGDPVAAAQAVGAGLRRLTALGSEFDDFLVSNLPGLGGDPDPADAFNAALNLEILALEDDGINVIFLDQQIFQAGLFPRLGALGITNVTEPCLVAPTSTSPGSDCTIVGFDAEGMPIRDLSIADTFYLIDDVHPTGPVQEAFGQFAISAVANDLPAPVPLPAGLPLLAGGLLGFGLLRRRAA